MLDGPNVAPYHHQPGLVPLHKGLLGDETRRQVKFDWEAHDKVTG